jgi:hypothetical protein
MASTALYKVEATPILPNDPLGLQSEGTRLFQSHAEMINAILDWIVDNGGHLGAAVNWQYVRLRDNRQLELFSLE